MKTALLATLAIVTAGFIAFWTITVLLARPESADGARPRRRPGWLDLTVGFVTNFFDTLGIGSFATTSAFFKLWGLVRDEQIPGTLNVGHTLPSIAEAFIYIVVLRVDAATLILMIAASAVGAWLGAGVVSHWPRRKIQFGMGGTLLAAAAIMVMTQLQWLPGAGDRLGLSGIALAIAIVGNAVLGALMALGIGLFAPCMIMVSLLGMDPRSAFPIMMGSCAFLMPLGSARFIRARSYNLKSALGLALGGLPAVLLAAFLVKSLPLSVIRWLVVIVVIYTAVMLLRSAILERRRDEGAEATVTAPVG